MHTPSSLRIAGLILSLSAGSTYAQVDNLLDVDFHINVLPPTGSAISMQPGDDLQAFIANNQGHEIVLPVGFTHTGSLILPNRCGTNLPWTIIRSGGSIPSLGTRVGPGDAPNMAVFITNEEANPILHLGTTPAIQAAHSDNGCFPQRYWISGVEVKPADSLEGFNGDLVDLGNLSEQTPATQAYDIVLDRSYVHGFPMSSGKVTDHGVRMDGTHIAVINSYVADFFDIWAPGGKQTQAVYAISAQGPLRITNNILEATTENALFGGDDPASCSVNETNCTVISNVTFTKNLVRKDPAWVSDPHGWCFGPLFELKNAQNVKIDGNDFEYEFQSICDGGLSQFSIIFTPRDQETHDKKATVNHVEFTNNYVRHVAGGISILGRDNQTDRDDWGNVIAKHISDPAHDILISNNVFEDVRGNWHDSTVTCDQPCTPRAKSPLIMLTLPPNWSEYNGAIAYPDNVTIDHNTFINDDPGDNSYISISCDDCTDNPMAPYWPKIPHFRFTNNIVGEVWFGVSGQGTGIDGTAGDNSSFKKYFDSTLVFTNNMIVGVNGQNQTSPQGWYDGSTGAQGTMSGNTFPPAWTDVGFVNYNNGNGGNYCLASGTTGADITALESQQASPGAGCTNSPGGGFTNGDVGDVGLLGSASLSGSTWTVKGAGADIWGSNDGFQFVYQQITGDGAIIARVTGVQSANTFAKAGLMIRASLDANAANALIDLRPSTDVEFLTRTSAGASTTYAGGAVQTPPAWLKLERNGSTITASVSADGISWSAINTATVTLAATAYWGLAVTSHDRTQLNTSTFDHVSIAAGGFTSQDVGTVGLAGNSSLSGATWTVKGAGADIWGTADAFQFNYQQMIGDGTLVARVTGVQNTSAFAKAGLMIRESLNPNAAHAILDARPTTDIEFMTRASTGAQTTFVQSATQATPAWLKLRRVGSTITASISGDGTSWTTVGTTTLNIATQAYWGLVVTSHDTTQLNASTFDHVSVIPAGGLPHFDVPFSVPGILQAEDFNDGGESVAYHDNVPGNAGGQYRISEDVDIVAATGNASGYVVNNFETGEWLDYTIGVSTAGAYNIALNVSSEFSNSAFHLEVDGVAVSGSIGVPNTGSWGTFQLVTANGITLTAGTHVLRVVSDQQYFNFDAVQVSQ